MNVPPGLSPIAPSPRAPRHAWLRDPMVLLILGVLSLYLGVNGVMFWYSLHAGTDLVSKDYYSRAEHYDETLSAEAANRATGWQARLTADAAPGGMLTLAVSDADGRPVSGLTGAASAYRPSDASLDQNLALNESPDQPGTYRLHFANPVRGLWEISLDLRAPNGRLDERVRVVIP